MHVHKDGGLETSTYYYVTGGSGGLDMDVECISRLLPLSSRGWWI